MGVVYKAVQLSLDRTVALKVLPPTLARERRFLERFDREARALAELAHPNIVAIFDRGVDRDLSYIVMEFVDGVSLRQVLQAGGLQPAEALAIVPKICAALEYAHARGVIHRDVKPENILLDRQGGVKVADFGLSRILGHDPAGGRITGTNVVMGTFDYMAPEQRERARDVDHRADLYALGVILYELLTGELPLGLFEAPSQRRPGLDPRLDDVVLRVLEKDPDRRHQRASELADAIATVARDGAGAAASPTPAAPGRAFRTPPPPAAAALPSAGATSQRIGLSGWMILLIVLGLLAMLAPVCLCGGWWLFLAR
jgi:serine/threonine protein kinase